MRWWDPSATNDWEEREPSATDELGCLFRLHVIIDFFRSLFSALCLRLASFRCPRRLFVASHVGSVSAFVFRFVVCGVGSVFVVLGRVCCVGSLVSFPYRLFQQRLKKPSITSVNFKMLPVFAQKKKAKTFECLMLRAPPIPPKFKVERCSSTRLYKICLFFGRSSHSCTLRLQL